MWSEYDQGNFKFSGYYVPTTRIRECLVAVDPMNTALHWATPITRRVYSVPHPNALWHLDGNYKLIRYVYFNSIARIINFRHVYIEHALSISAMYMYTAYTRKYSREKTFADQ